MSYSSEDFKSIYVGGELTKFNKTYKILNICSSQNGVATSMDIAFTQVANDYYVRYSDDNETTWSEWEHVG